MIPSYTKTKLALRSAMPTLITSVPANETVTNVVMQFLKRNASNSLRWQHLNHIVKAADKVIKSLGDNTVVEISLVPSNRGRRYHFTICIITPNSYAGKLFDAVDHPSGLLYLGSVNWLGVAGLDGRFIPCNNTSNVTTFIGHQLVDLGWFPTLSNR
jgi:hypothetical protein